MSALIDLPGVSNPLEDDWWLLEGCASGLVMGRLSEDVRTDEVVSAITEMTGDWPVLYAVRWWYVMYMEYVLYGEDTIGQIHRERDVDWRTQSYFTCQLRTEELGVCTHCKVESWSANWWKIAARCYSLVNSDFMHERAFSFLLQISGSLPPYTSTQDPR